MCIGEDSPRQPMPHVVVAGSITPEAVAECLEPVMERTEQGVLKADKAYLALDKQSIVIEALAIEGGNKQSFLAMVQGRPDGVVVRLHPLVDPEKTDGVKRILALIGRQIKEKFEGASFGETNLDAFLGD